jgi:hypothetical protein
VGRSGTILGTTDGGTSWRSQSSATSEPISSVHFADARRGWAVGNGVILATTDGGGNWHQQPLPVYWSFCPPWYLWISPLFLVGLVALNRRRVSVSEGILGVPISDNAVETLDQDSLGAHRLVNTLVGFVTNRATLPPLCITVEGPWGTGKSSVLQMIRSQLKKKRAAQTVWFNAWHHQKEDPLLAYLLEAIKREAVPPVLSLNGLLFRLDLLLVRFQDKPLHFAIAGAAIVAAALFWSGKGNIPTLDKVLPGDFHGPLAIVAALGYFYQTFLRAFGSNPDKLLESGRTLLNFGDLQGKTDVRSDFQKELKDVVRALQVQQRRLVIFLDDLDRCRPEQVVVVMEAVNFLSAAADCFIFLGTDREKVLTAVGLHYKSMAVEEAQAQNRPEYQVRRELAESYLRKMINLRTHVPRPEEKETQSYLETQMLSKGSSWKHPAQRVAVIVLALCIASGWAIQKYSGVDLTSGGTQVQVPAPPVAPDGSPAGVLQNNAKGPVTDPIPQLDPSAVLLPQGAAARWLWLLAVSVIALVSFLFWLRVKLRPDIEDTQDRPEFTQALAAAAQQMWAKAGGNPREAKRLRNTLRFLAASDRARMNRRSDDRNWEPNLVGFAAFERPDKFPMGWKWTPTSEQALAYQQLCVYAELDPKTLEPIDGAERPRSNEAANSGS